MKLAHANRQAAPGAAIARIVPVSERRTSLLALACLVLVACGDDQPTAPPNTLVSSLVVLNSTGQTLAPFEVDGDRILPARSPIDLGAGFDGDGVALSGTLAASSVSSFGGSRIAIVDLELGNVVQVGFPGPDAPLVNPSRASFGSGDTIWVGGRGSDAVYRVAPGSSMAELVAEGIGTFVERVVPAADELYAIDANLDDDGLTYAPNGPGRIVVLDRAGTVLDVIELAVTAPNPSDAVLVAGRLIVLAGGTFDPSTFMPNLDGALVSVDPLDRRVITMRPLGANGIRLALGADGLVYITTTRDFLSLDLLRYDPAAEDFDRSPEDPIRPVDPAGDPVSCWAASALADGRLVCTTFRTDAPGRLLLLNGDGEGISQTTSGFGSTDIGIRP
jgi:hypothetical protein